MTPEHHRRVGQLFQDALELTAGERSAFLSRSCGGDDVLKSEVESLLSYEATKHAVMDGSALEAVGRAIAAVQSQSWIGQQVSHYRILSRLGGGGMGEVYRARDIRLGRDVAVKTLPFTYAEDGGRLKRFEEEAQAVGQLNHPNVVVVHDVGVHDGVPFIVTELLEGEDLRQQLNRGALPPHRVIDYAQQIARGLAATHARGIVHRDLKPENLLVSRDGHVKILDFGLAKLTGTTEAEPPRSTQRLETLPGFVVGTVGYLAPEQLYGERADHRADVFAFGVILYEMLSGRRPFERASPSETMAATLRDEPAELEGGTGQSTLNRIVRRCLAKDPEQRFQSARDLGFALDMLSSPSSEPAGTRAAVTAPFDHPDALQGRRGTTSAVPTRDQLGATDRGSRRRVGRRMLLTAPLLAVGVTAVGAWLVLSGRQPVVQDGSVQPVRRFVVGAPRGTEISSTFPFALSPDGRHLVFGARSGNASQLYVRALDQFEARAIPGTDGGGVPAFSPDGQSIAFRAGGKLKKVAVFSNAPPVTLADFGGCCAGGNLTWLPDDRIVMGRMNVGIVAVSAQGGVPTLLIEPDASRGERDFHSPQQLPGGQSLLVSVHRGADTYDIAAIRLDTGERRVLVENAFDARYVQTGHLVFARPGMLLAAPFDLDRLQLTGPAIPLLEDVRTQDGDGAARYHIAADGTLAYLPAIRVGGRTLAWVDRNGNREPLPLEPAGFIAPTLSPRGDRLAVQINEPTRRDIWIYDFGSGVMNRVTFDGTSAGPIWTPDGQRVVFSSTRNGRRQIYAQAADGMARPELLVEEINAWVGSWSSDNANLAYVRSSTEGQFDIGLFRVPDRRAGVVIGTGAAEQWPRISPDGRWLAYVSSETGRFEVYVTPLADPRRRRQLSVEGGVSPVWTSDGRELFYRRLRDDRLIVVPVSDLAATPGTPIALPVDIRMASGTLAHPGYDVSIDGRRVLVVEPDDNESAPANIAVVLNWHHELKRLAPFSAPRGK